MPVPVETLPPRPLLRESVLDRLRSAIVDGTLAPQEKLRDAEIAAWLGVSRTPVREALLELGRAGLVQALPGRSTVVSPLEERTVRDAQAVVAAMHALAVSAAVLRMSADDIERMRTANAAFAAAQADGDVDAAHRADRTFHAVAVEASGNAAVRTVLDQFEPVLERAERLRFASHEGQASVERHERLIELCATGDATGAAHLAEAAWASLEISAPDGAANDRSATQEDE